MEDKKQDVKSLEELLKAADEFRKWAVDFGNKLSKVLPDIEIPEEKEDTWEMKCPYEHGDTHYCIQPNGSVFADCWEGIESDNRYFSQGNVFPTEEAAELEAKRRNLLTRFRAFRDECNGDWKPDFTINSNKYFIEKRRGKIVVDYIWTVNSFILFGYFKNHEDAKRAIELFGDEIEELFVDCEAQ
ncbi:hypothetical protein [uncultured Prevotella sp.]|uniref:hypothetical protein n=1 Tax=uncultured Prevotella sp. TaxID=159272 RepID=UPI00259AFAAF|nr:hypothetical protein [uncultured Prevotella sp.]